jgi:hypothetical protein
MVVVHLRNAAAANRPNVVVHRRVKHRAQRRQTNDRRMNAA